MDQELFSNGTKIKKELFKYFPLEKFPPIIDAINIAQKAFKGQKRKNGEPVILHNLAVGYKTAEMGLGPRTVAAAILHDLYKPEISEKYSKEVKTKIGEDVDSLISNVTSLRNQEVEQIGDFTDLQSAQKYLLSSTCDLRVIMIKLAEKYHNLITMDAHNKDKRDEFVKEIEKIYIPLSEYLGLGTIHKDLASEIVRYKNRMKYNMIKDFIDKKRKITEKVKDTIIEELKEVCEMAEIDATIQGRTKSIASIYDKQFKYLREGKRNQLENITDILGFRLFCKNIEDCYKAQSAISSLYDIEKGSEDDYIAHPKPNGYQAIHICPIHPKHGVLEIQILTNSMHFYNTFGPASHMEYKKSGERYAKITEDFDWIRQIHKANIEEDKPITAKLFEDQIFVFTPKKDIIQLPKDATPIDFAYSLHSQLGDHCTGVLINKKAKGLDTKLQTGDIVEIRTDKNKKYASEEWLEFAVTNLAKKKIKDSVAKKIKVSI